MNKFNSIIKKLHSKIAFIALFGILAMCCSLNGKAQWNPNHSIGTQSGKTAFSYNQIPDPLMEVIAPQMVATTVTYQWEQGTAPVDDYPFTPISGATQSTYTFSTPLSQTTYFRRKTTDNTGNSIYSNIIKIEVVSTAWENRNYVREISVKKSLVLDWKNVDMLPSDQKLQTTTYTDGAERTVQVVNKDIALINKDNNTWGDVVQFFEYDQFGRTPKSYLPYTTTTEAGNFKSNPLQEQTVYYGSNYNETNAYAFRTFDNSPLNRVVNIKKPGTAWSAGAGESEEYDLNNDGEVPYFTIDYYSIDPTDMPIYRGYYQANTLLVKTRINENGKKEISYTDKSGHVILTKNQLDDTPQDFFTGWICVYSIYDNMNNLRCRMQPEAIKYLKANNWFFSGANGDKVLNEWCFRYKYDEKGRVVSKKAPGAKELRMVYDERDRLVFSQDGNQAGKTTPEWLASLYDELDRVVVTAIYKTNKTQSALQADVAGAVTTTVSVTNPGNAVVDLVVNTREQSVTSYTAQNSITFEPDENGNAFSSGDNDEFVAEIDPLAKTAASASSIVTIGNPISSADLNNPDVITILKYNFYDDYSFAGVKPFDNKYVNKSAYNDAEPGVLPITPSRKAVGKLTGSMVRVLGTNTFLSATQYYDDEGRDIQILADNIKHGYDIRTSQYHWDGRLLSIHEKHLASYSGMGSYNILTKLLFDRIGRVVSVQKRYGANDFKTVVAYSYDDLARVKTKQLDPGYTGTGKNALEELNYSYNINSNIIGINKEYALKTAGVYNKWDHFFGMYLGFDNRDGVFDAAKLDGHVTGLLWSTQGDDVQRKYDYTYDNAGRLTKAVFKEKQQPADAWSNNMMDFSVMGTSGKIAYDLNGNLLSMIQKGVLPGSAAPITVDDLSYSYAELSNKLTKVVDNTPQTSTNGAAGDFKDGSNGVGDDYVYDDNGNLVVDLNKNVKDLDATTGYGIEYNYMDKPERIRIAGKGTIQLVYSATGVKLQRIYTPENGGTPVTTTYINGFVYKGNELQTINFEEGRIRIMQPVAQSNGYDAVAIDGNMTMPNGKKGAFDFYIKDYQQNVRVILTEETHVSTSTCTMETARSGNEEPVFGQTGGANEVVQTRTVTPAGWQSNGSSAVSKLTKLAQTIGPNSLLKVMAGDQLNAMTQYYYLNPVTNTTTTGLATNVVNSLVQAISGGTVASNLAHVQAGAVGTQLNGSAPFISSTGPDAANAAGNSPKAYLNILFFDERFNFVPENSTSVRVSQAGDAAAPLVLANIKAPKNGYAYVYVSNESDEAVYFDNFQVVHNRGRIIEEDHYYAFGLKIAAISSNKLTDANEGGIENKNLYNAKELFDDGDLGWYDYGFRNYDAQIGRFTQLDPLTDKFPYYTPFQYAGNEPIANVDLDGLEPLQMVTVYALKKTPHVVPSLRATAIAGFSLANPHLRDLPPPPPAPPAPKSFNWGTRIWGGLKATWGTLEMFGGATFGSATSWTGGGAIIGVLAIGDGADNVATGFKQMWTGEDEKTLVHQGISEGFQYAGMSQKDADRWAGYTSTLTTTILTFGSMGGARFTPVPIASSAAAEGAVVTEGVAGTATGEGRAFWSGAGTESQALADGFETLGQTRAGKNLINLTKDMPYYPAMNGQPASQAYQWWEKLSTQYAKGAVGPVHVYQLPIQKVGNQSIWRLFEYPALKANPNVTEIIFHY